MGNSNSSKPDSSVSDSVSNSHNIDSKQKSLVPTATIPAKTSDPIMNHSNRCYYNSSININTKPSSLEYCFEKTIGNTFQGFLLGSLIGFMLVMPRSSPNSENNEIVSQPNTTVTAAKTTNTTAIDKMIHQNKHLPSRSKLSARISSCLVYIVYFLHYLSYLYI